ncbi:hypothetical protein INT44_001457 [Umbelopsis vinacea]|uniref:Uncharacterized protein n=1 Tax=Umbelopsis vinacea TaxID=44442 RepID=A0A8H7PQD7_9FUNG|nr:hypothetical protein INT44_001457 [Umbelopsis vinacea]
MKSRAAFAAYPKEVSDDMPLPLPPNVGTDGGTCPIKCGTGAIGFSQYASIFYFMDGHYESEPFIFFLPGIMNKKARHIIIAINPTSQEAEHTVDWAISNILDSNRDQVDLVCALDLDVDFTDDVVSDVPAMYDYQYLNDLEQQAS